MDWKLQQESTFFYVQVIVADLASETENFVWKGKERLELRDGGKIGFPAGFAPKAVFQMNPPASVTAVALQSSWEV